MKLYKRRLRKHAELFAYGRYYAKNGVCVVISNYSRLQNIENTSQDLIHCKMQGALNWKTMRVVCHICASFVLFSLKSSTQLHNHCRIIVEENSVKYVPLDGFFRIQILPNSISAGALSRSPLGRLTTLPQTAYSRLGRGTPLPTSHPLDAFGVSPTVPHHFSKPFAAPGARAVFTSLDLQAADWSSRTSREHSHWN